MSGKECMCKEVDMKEIWYDKYDIRDEYFCYIFKVWSDILSNSRRIANDVNVEEQVQKVLDDDEKSERAELTLISIDQRSY